MVLDAFANFVRGETVASIDNSQTTVSVDDASIFPDPSTDGEFNVVIWDAPNFPRPDQDPDTEIMRVTAIDTVDDNLTVTRGQETTAAAAHPSESAIHLSPTAKMFGDIEDTFADFWDSDAQALTADVNNDLVSADESATEQTPYVDVTHPTFGAVGDGSTDDAKAIQDAIDYANTNDLAVFIPSGDYAFGTQLTIPSEVNVFGGGFANVILRYTGSDTYAIKPTGSGGRSMVSGFKLISDGGTSGTHGIGKPETEAGGRRCRFERIWVEDFPGDGFHMEEIWNTVFRDCQAGDNDRGGYLTTDGGAVAFDGCRFNQNDTEGLRLDRISGVTYVSGGDYSTNGSRGIGLNGVNSVRISGTYHEGQPVDIEGDTSFITNAHIAPSTCFGDVGIRLRETLSTQVELSTRFDNSDTAVRLGASGASFQNSIVLGDVRQDGAGGDIDVVNAISSYQYGSGGGNAL